MKLFKVGVETSTETTYFELVNAENERAAVDAVAKLMGLGTNRLVFQDTGWTWSALLPNHGIVFKVRFSATIITIIQAQEGPR